MKAKQQSSLSSSLSTGLGSSALTADLSENTTEQRVRRRAALASTLQPSERGLGSRYRRKLLEAVTNSAFSTAHKKKTAGSEGKQSTGYHNQPMDAPLLFYLPCEGGLNATCVTCAPVPVSLSGLCADGDMCAFCLTHFEPGMKLFSPAYIAGMQRRREKDKKARAAKKRKLSGDSNNVESGYEDDGFKQANYLVSKTVGTVSHVLHQQCAFAVDNGGLSGILALALKLNSSPEHPPDDTPSAGNSDTHVGKFFKGIDLGDFYECDETDDAECDLCGRAGGIMQFFDLDSRYSSLPPPGEEGWLGHVPCVSWLISSRLLELPPSFLCKRGFLREEYPTASTSAESYSPLKGCEVKDDVTASSETLECLELNPSSSVVTEILKDTEEVERVGNGEEITLALDVLCPSDHYQSVEAAVMATIPSCDEMSSNTVVMSISSELRHEELLRATTDCAPILPAILDDSVPPTVPAIIVTESNEGVVSTLDEDAVVSATALSLKRGAPDTIDGRNSAMSDAKDNSQASSSLKRRKTSSTIESEEDTAERPLNDCINYWSTSTHSQDVMDVGSATCVVIQDEQTCLRDEGITQSEMSNSLGDSIEVPSEQSAQVDAALPDTVTVANPTLHDRDLSNGRPESKTPYLEAAEAPYTSYGHQKNDPLDSDTLHSLAGPSRDHPRKQSNLSESDKIGSSGRRDDPNVRPLSLFDSLVGQWRCSCCGTYAGVVLKCSAVACTVRAHPLCVTIAGPKWTAFEASSSGMDQSEHDSPTALGFLCALHSTVGSE